MRYQVLVETKVCYDVYVDAETFGEAETAALRAVKEHGDQDETAVESRIMDALPSRVCNDIEHRVAGVFEG